MDRRRPASDPHAVDGERRRRIHRQRARNRAAVTTKLLDQIFESGFILHRLAIEF